MYLNTFAQGLEPIDLTGTDEYASLVASAHDLGIGVPASVRYRSCNTVVNGLRFHYLEWGDPGAPPMLLLHGGNQTGHSWDLVSLHFSDRYHIIALDERGHGDTEWPRDGVADRHAMADDARRLVEVLGLEKPVIGGHSMGGIVTLTLLSAHPEVASKAVIVDVGPELSPEGSAFIGDFIQSVHEVPSLDFFVDRVAEYDVFRSKEHIRRTARYNLLQRADGKLVSKHDHRNIRRVGPNGELLRRIDQPSLEDVAHITCPLLLLRGAESNVLLPEAAHRFISLLPKGSLVEVPGAGHNVHSQNTPYFIDVVAQFLAS